MRFRSEGNMTSSTALTLLSVVPPLGKGRQDILNVIESCASKYGVSYDSLEISPRGPEFLIALDNRLLCRLLVDRKNRQSQNSFRKSLQTKGYYEFPIYHPEIPEMESYRFKYHPQQAKSS